ncbi:MAG: arsenic resistance N-acetyltransferase ArsN2 [bacterium]
MNTTKPPTAPSVRHATDADLPRITALLTASDLPTVGVAEALDGFFVAEDGADIVGVVGIETCCDRYALLRSTAVAASWRGRGLGRRLVERALSEAESQGIEAMYLLTTTAEAYFPSFGFSAVTRDDVPDEVKATDEFQSACPASATVMTRSLSSRGPST